MDNLEERIERAERYYPKSFQPLKIKVQSAYIPKNRKGLMEFLNNIYKRNNDGI